MKTDSSTETLAMITVQTSSEGWQETCLTLAKSREDFLVDAFTEDDMAFFKKLCRTSNYRRFIVEKGLLFLPAP